MSRRGATLIELMVSLAILGVILSIAVATLVGLSTIIRLSNLKRATAAIARQAAQAVERDVALAGYGIEPALAFDFNIYQGDGAYCGGAPGSDVTSNPCAAARDRVDGPDEVVFYFRNPAYWGGDLAGPPEGKAWSLVAAASDSITLFAHGGEFFGRGQILQLVCSGGTASGYVRVSQTTSPAAPGPVLVSLEAPVPGDPFTQSAEDFWADCGGVARVFQVDRHRYYVDPAAVLADGSTAPFLMLDMGVDRNGDGQVDPRDVIPVAQGIADLQVSFVRPEPALIQVGGTPGASLAFCSNALRPVSGPGLCAGGLRVVDFTAGAGARDYASYSYLTVSSGAALRRGADSANVTAVHVGLVARSLTQAPTVDSLPLLLNRSVRQADEADQPHVYQSTQVMVVTPNLQARGLTFL